MNNFIKFISNVFLYIFGLIGGLGSSVIQNPEFIIGLFMIAVFIYTVIEIRSQDNTVTKARNIMIAFAALFGGIMTGSQISKSNSSDDNVSTILVYLADIYIY